MKMHVLTKGEANRLGGWLLKKGDFVEYIPSPRADDIFAEIKEERGGSDVADVVYYRGIKVARNVIWDQP